MGVVATSLLATPSISSRLLCAGQPSAIRSMRVGTVTLAPYMSVTVWVAAAPGVAGEDWAGVDRGADVGPGTAACGADVGPATAACGGGVPPQALSASVSNVSGAASHGMGCAVRGDRIGIWQPP
jgi:hypothetical protein